jgi:cytochrome c-type biogenesis protein CcmH
MSDEQAKVLSRRAFLTGAGGGAGIGSMVLAARAIAQQPNPRARMTHDSSIVRDTSNLFAMDQGAARPVRLPPKANAVKQLTNTQRDALEHQLHCQCGCTLDVFTCRTTDFSCQVSPAMHRDVMALVDGGYSAQEIIDAFVATYGERVLMAPPRSGFNMLAWVSPGIAVLVAAAFILAFLRRSQSPKTAPLGPAAKGVDATDDELARLEAAIRRDGE